MMIAAEYVSVHEMRKICDVSERSVRKWIVEFDSESIRDGRTKLFPASGIAEWLTGKNDKAAALLNEFAREVGDNQVEMDERADFVKQALANARRRMSRVKKRKFPPAKKKSAKATSAVTESESSLSTIDIDEIIRASNEETDIDCYRLRNILGKLIVECQVNVMLSGKANDGVTAAQARKELREMAKIHISLEEACLKSDEILKRVIPVDEARKFIGKIAAKIRADILCLPMKVVDDVRAAPDKKAALEVLRNGCTDALRHLSEELK